MPINDFRPFAIDIGANVVTQDDYLVKPELVEGFTVGILKSELANKVWRQSSFVASAIAQFIMNELGEDVIDNDIRVRRPDGRARSGRLIAASANKRQD